MRLLKITWGRIKASIHRFVAFHTYNIIWYNGPGYEDYNEVWKFHCNQCTKVYYLDPKINALLEAELAKQKVQELEKEAVRSRMH